MPPRCLTKASALVPAIPKGHCEIMGKFGPLGPCVAEYRHPLFARCSQASLLASCELEAAKEVGNVCMESVWLALAVVIHDTWLFVPAADDIDAEVRPARFFVQAVLTAVSRTSSAFVREIRAHKPVFV
mmetsp:Transcript_99982/g.291623  ORF Transcript_99982/g.291623 Transcript_99982/m.291623 type:complete len:129 (+) Transcript_99982:477-863(+)